MSEQIRKCADCNKILEGRLDKKFCNVYCKSSFHYKQKLNEEDNLYEKIDKTLKQNRRILKSFNKAGKATVRENILIEAGFNPMYFTHYWKNNKNEVYLFCYEYGFLKKKEHGKTKYVLVTWQKYMDK